MASCRTSMQVVGNILTATEESGQKGIKTATLISKANLSHSRLSKLLLNLIGTYLVNRIEYNGIEYNGKNTFVITQKGRQYLESYQKFSTVAESFILEI